MDNSTRTTKAKSSCKGARVYLKKHKTGKNVEPSLKMFGKDEAYKIKKI